MKFKNLSIIGGGPNAVYALEILLKRLISRKNLSHKTIRIFEKTGLFGCGKTHSKKLNDNVLLNRVAGQISLGSAPFLKFPKRLNKYDYNFMEWKKKQTQKKINNLKSYDWPSRNIFGKAMEAKFYDIVKIYREETNVNIELYPENVLSLKKGKNKKIILKTKDREFVNDNVLVVSGNYISSKIYSKLSKHLYNLTRGTDCIYEHNFLDKLDDQNYWEKIKNKKILIYGTGVSSLDIILMLNKKNTIYPISRSFLFPFARPKNQKLSNPKKLEHKGFIFKKEIALKLKKIINKDSNSNKITFQELINPLIKIEFYLIYFKKYLHIKDFKKLLQLSKKNFGTIKNFKKINFNKSEIIIDNYVTNLFSKKRIKKNFFKNNWFSQKNIINSVLTENYTFYDFFKNPMLICKKNYSKEYIKFINWDIKEAIKGNLKSPYKMACDGLWRDLRQEISLIFDDSLNLSLYEYFLKNELTIHNRLCDGPSLNMNKKIKDLISKKILKIDHRFDYKIKRKNNSIYLHTNKKFIKIDYIFSAIADIYKQNYYKDNFINNLLKNGIIALNRFGYRNKKILGIKLDKNQNPILNKKIFKNITFAGPASEGSKFFHHTLSRPDKKQLNFNDLLKWTKNL